MMVSIRVFLSSVLSGFSPFISCMLRMLLLWWSFRESYMEQPPGFVVQEESCLVCKLHRSLYGSKKIFSTMVLVMLTLSFRSLKCFKWSKSFCFLSIQLFGLVHLSSCLCGITWLSQPTIKIITSKHLSISSITSRLKTWEKHFLTTQTSRFCCGYCFFTEKISVTHIEIHRHSNLSRFSPNSTCNPSYISSHKSSDTYTKTNSFYYRNVTIKPKWIKNNK